MTKSWNLFLKIYKKVDDGTMAELKCNHWRRDSITNITSDVVAFCQLSAHKLSTFFEIFKNFEKFKIFERLKNFWKNEKFLRIQKLWKFLKTKKIEILKVSEKIRFFWKNWKN